MVERRSMSWMSTNTRGSVLDFSTTAPRWLRRVVASSANTGV
jgi:hypothetical protein